MGSLEAFLVAAFFHLFGVSVFTLRLGTVLLFALFLAGKYLLAAQQTGLPALVDEPEILKHDLLEIIKA